MVREFTGRGCVERLPEMLDGCGGRVLLLTRESLLRRYGGQLKRLLPGEPDVLTDIEPNPRYEDIRLALERFEGRSYGVMVAFGGGSVIDFAKAFRYYSRRSCPLIAIPTTAGTGSEATQFAVVYVEGRKTSLDAPEILPDGAVIDSSFVENSPARLKACSAIDAYCQAIESFWAVRSTEESKKWAAGAIRLIREAIVPFVRTDDAAAAEAMSLGAHEAGKAINISRTTAAHALSYAFTSLYGIPHGHAVALSMVDVFAANASVGEHNVQDARGAAYVRGTMEDLCRLLSLGQAGDFPSYWHGLMEALGLEWRLDALHVDHVEAVLRGVNGQRLSNNPVDVTECLEAFYSGRSCFEHK